jgi:hypothetical protein
VERERLCERRSAEAVVEAVEAEAVEAGAVEAEAVEAGAVEAEAVEAGARQSDAVQSSSAQPSSAQSGAAQSGAAQSGAAQASSAQSFDEQVETALATVKRWGCALCWLHGQRVGRARHDIRRCPSARAVLLPDRDDAKFVFGFKRGRELGRGVCGRCWCAARYCARLAEPAAAKVAAAAVATRDCTYGDTIFPVVTHAWLWRRSRLAAALGSLGLDAAAVRERMR